MTRTIILKLGGSIITDKEHGRPTVRVRRVRAVAGALRRFLRERPTARIILLHGGGSFGHPLAHRYRIAGKALERRNWRGVARTTNAMRGLTTLLADIFLRADVPVIPLHTMSMIGITRGRVSLANPGLIRTILATKGIPLLGGDVAIADGMCSHIISADALAGAFAKIIPDAMVLFATDVPGVFPAFPPAPRERPLPFPDRKTLRRITSRKKPRTSQRDVTGGMIGKLRAIEHLRKHRIVIFDGRNIRVLASALRSEQVGTVIRT